MRGLWQTRDDRVDAGLNANFVPGPTTPGMEVITKLGVAYQAPQYVQPLLVFVPKASLLKLQYKYCRVVLYQPKSSRFDPRYRSAWRSV
jgi:hypothetical protein